MGKPSDYYEFDRQEMVKFLPASSHRVLDVGCGAGGFGRTLRRLRPGLELVGIEVHEEAARVAATVYDRVLVGTYPNALYGNSEPFDSIIFNDVLEHLVDPWAALAEAHKHIKGDGVVVCSIPNVRFLPVVYRLAVHGRFDYSVDGVLDRTHLRFFTRGSIVDMVEGAGYQIERLEGINPLRRWQLDLLRLVIPRFVEDTRHMQYAVVARPAQHRRGA